MGFQNAHIRTIMLVGGAITCTMLLAVISPDTSLRLMFGETIDSPIAQIVVRSWGMLIVLTGALLIIGALHPAYRTLAVVTATISKAVFVGALLLFGQAYLDKAMLTVIFDGALVLLFVAWLAFGRRA